MVEGQTRAEPQLSPEVGQSQEETPTRRLRQKISREEAMVAAPAAVERKTLKRTAAETAEELADSANAAAAADFEPMDSDVLIHEISNQACREVMLEEAEEPTQIRLDDGLHWMPVVDVEAGDKKEFEGLWQRRVFELATWESINSDGKYIDSRMIRRLKGDAVKSRWVLRDFAHGRAPEGGELYAATPSLGAFRLLMALGSLQLSQTDDHVFLVGDVTQAFPACRD